MTEEEYRKQQPVKDIRKLKLECRRLKRQHEKDFWNIVDLKAEIRSMAEVIEKLRQEVAFCEHYDTYYED